MLYCSHGASTLGKILRRPIIMTMNGLEETVGHASETIRTACNTAISGRLLSSYPTPVPSNASKIWQKHQPIVFNNSTREILGYTRSISTTVATEISQDPILNSVSEYTETLDEITAGASAGTEAPPEAADKTSSSKSEDAKKEGLVQNSAEDKVPKDYNKLAPSASPFKIPEEIFQKAKAAPSDSEESFWSHTLYRGPKIDGMEQKVKVHYCRSKQTTEKVIEKYFKDKKVLGFDIEWLPNAYKGQGPKKNVSLIQIASEDRIGLFHIALFPKDGVKNLVADSLKEIMEDPEITKVGVSIKADCTRLRRFLDINARGIFELSHLYKLVKFSESKDFTQINKRLVSLATQVNEHLHLPMFKGEVRSSDWSKALQLDQIVYAASDSYAGIHLYDTMEIKRKALDPVPPRPAHAELNEPIRLAEGVNIPTDDEGVEELDGADIEANSEKDKGCRKLSPSYLASALQDVEVDSDDVVAEAPSLSKVSKKKIPKSPIVLAAETQTAVYRDTHPKNRTTPASLRAYFIWHNNESLSLPEIAALLREIPLQTNTVTTYILEALRLEKLPFKKDRLKEIFDSLPEALVNGRYRSLSKALEESE
ncbi:hypothetical protein B7463_g1723, partial [Scytalidium lignicola]